MEKIGKLEGYVPKVKVEIAGTGEFLAKSPLVQDTNELFSKSTSEFVREYEYEYEYEYVGIMFLWNSVSSGGALGSTDILLSYPEISITLHITIIPI